MIKKPRAGFTVVELLIVIVVIAVLASITFIAYGSLQNRARDLKNTEGVTKLADAIELFIAKNQHFPRGGSGSSSGIGSNSECVNGSNGFAGKAMYTCTVEDTLIASGLLPTGFSKDLTPHPKYSYTDGRASIMVYSAGANDAMVMVSLIAPSDQDTAHFNSELKKCFGSVPGSYAPRDTYGMRNGVCVSFSLP